jgi:integrase
MRLLMGVSKDRHGTYYAIKKVPARLEHAVAQALGGAKARQSWLKRSLGTKNAEQANRRAKAVLIEFDHTLERAEALLAKRPLRTSLSAVEIKRMAEYHYAKKLASHDEYLRIAPEEERALRQLEPGETWTDPVPAFGLSRGQVADANVSIPEVLRDAEAALAQGNIGHIDIQIDDVLSAFQINLDPHSAAYRELGLALLRAHVRAIRAMQRRHAGEPIETPPMTQIGAPAVPTGETLSAALDGWRRERERPAATLAEYERAIRLFTELHGDLPIVQMKRSHARQFREALQQVPRTRTGKLLKAPLPELAEWGHKHPEAQKINPGTVNKLLGGVQAIAIWARDKGGMVPDDVQWADPFSRMRLEVDDSDRAPFEPDELQTIFSSPVFTKGERPIGGKGDAAFWLPLLGLFTGARRGELASLRPSDIAHDPAIDAVAIYFTADRKAGKRLKNRQSVRVVPVHPELKRLGFLDFVAEQARTRGNDAWLFPQIAPGTSGAKDWSKWFTRYLHANGIKDTAKVFHSFRHGFVDALRAANVSDELNTALVGHRDGKRDGRVHAMYGAKKIARRFGRLLYEAVERVTYPELDLAHLRYRKSNGRATGGKYNEANRKERA